MRYWCLNQWRWVAFSRRHRYDYLEDFGTPRAVERDRSTFPDQNEMALYGWTSIPASKMTRAMQRPWSKPKVEEPPEELNYEED